ncbi:MAG: hypothetical protein WAM91_14410 [Candidatus Acidiferrales bacterium]
MKSGTIKSAQRDACLPPACRSGRAGTAAGGVQQIPLAGVIRLPAGRHGESGVGPTCPPGAQISDSRATSSPTANGAAVICNIAEQSWILHRTHGTFVIAGVDRANSHNSVIPIAAPNSGSVIPSRSAGEGYPDAQFASGVSSAKIPYALTVIGARTGAIDLGDKRTLEFPISAREIAADLAREINSDGGEGSYFGVFVCAGDEPDDGELADAHAQLDGFYRNLVAAAEKEWERTHSVVFISDLQRRAARELKLEKEWSYEPQQRMDCPACGEKLKPGVAVCRVCGAVLDRAKAAQFGLVAQQTASSSNTPNAATPVAP